MQNDLKKAWQKAFQEVLLKESKSRFAEMFVNFLSIAGNLLLTFGCWVWWRSDIASGDGLVMAATSLLVHFVMVYETGYKKSFCAGRQRYFYAVWLVPVLLSVIGFIGGLFYKGIL